MMRHLRFHAGREFLRNTIAIHLADERPNGQVMVAQPVVFSPPVDDSVMFTDPMLRMPVASAQNLMDELWSAGLRPTEGAGSAGSLAATERHLADMKAIAFHTLKINNQKGNP